MLSLLDALVKPLKSQSSLKSAVFNYKTSFSLFFFTQLIQEGLRDTLQAYFGLIQV